jgi:plastocyanin
MRRLLAAVCVIAGSVFVAATPAQAGGGCHNPEATEATGSTIETRNACFEPTVLRVEPGTTVTFVNRDGIEHDISGVNLEGWNRLGAGVSVPYRFDATGTFPYTCNLHPGMTGVVVVGDGKGEGRAVQVAEPVLANVTRSAPVPPSDDGGVNPALVAAVAAAAGLAGGFFLQKRRAARA